MHCLFSKAMSLQGASMTEAEIKEFRSKALAQAKRRKHRNDADDIAQEVVISWALKELSGGQVNQTMNQAVKQGIRRINGDERRIGKNGVRRVTDLVGKEIQRFQKDDGIENTLDRNQVLAATFKQLQGIDRLLISLICIYGFSLKELGHCLGTTASAVSYRVKTILKRIEGMKNEQL
jgi:DNA-directed RNA polymerase specialized sigma subunit